MQTAPFTVMDASAGSGKTYQLVLRVLTTALRHADAKNALRPLMAITFTNKAAAEMKERLLAALVSFGAADVSKNTMLQQIAEDLNLTHGQVIARSRNLLKHILHKYNDLSFGTIDSFTARLVRTFAKDLALSENFEILLDPTELLQQTTNEVLDKAGIEPKLTDILVQFVAQKLNDEKSWNIDGALLDMAGKLLQEKHRKPLEKLSNYSTEDLLDIRQKLLADSHKLSQQLIDFGTKGLQLIADNGIDHGSFQRGAQGLPGHFVKMQRADFAASQSFNSYVTKGFDENSWYSGKANASQKAAIDGCIDALKNLAENGRAFAEKHTPFVYLAEEIGRSMYSFATLQALSLAMQHIQEVQNTLPLGVFNSIINQKLKDEPAAYIFERLGDRYKHFFVDEFQDTSKLQWQNLLPLLENGLAESGTALVVGDAKQSIYRWRNGEAEQFIDLSKKTEGGVFNASAAGNLIRLDKNYRSKPEVVAFNNALFCLAAENLADENYNHLYKNASQEATSTSGGLVKVHLFEKEDFANEAIQQTLQIITETLAQGYSYRDIALLVRRKSDGAALVTELSTRGLPVISADSLFVGNSYEGQLLAAFTALRTAPNNKIYRWQLANSLVQLNMVAPQSAFVFAQNIIDPKADGALQFLETHFQGLKTIFSAPTDLYSFTKNLCRLLGLDTKSNAFVEAYLQNIHDFLMLENMHASQFVGWWEKTGSIKTIHAPETMDAIQVVTIHKSKGLQYPVVVVPFVNWSVQGKTKQAWVEIDPDLFYGLDEMLVNLSKEKSAAIGGHYAEMYNILFAQEEFDSLNILYVACTRAVNQLHLCTTFGKKDTISQTLDNYLNTQTNKKITDNCYQWGEAELKSRTHKEPETTTWPLRPSSGWQRKLRVARQAPVGWQNNQTDARDWGNRVHYLLAQVQHAQDLQRVMHDFTGVFSPEERADLAQKTQAVIAHPMLANLFSEANKNYVERDIIIPEGQNKRPDRLVQTPAGVWLLADYKTGAPLPEHKTQIQEYMALLAACGIAVSQAYLVYLAEDILVEVVEANG